MEYSFKKGLWKGVKAALTVALAMIVFAGLSDLTIWGLLEQYLKPALGSLSVGGLFAMVINYIKVKKQA